MNDLRMKDKETIDGGIREAMARVEEKEKAATEIPMPKASSTFNQSMNITPLQISQSAEKQARAQYDSCLQLIADKEKLVQKITEDAVKLMADLQLHSSELGELKTYALKLGIVHRAHGMALKQPANGG